MKLTEVTWQDEAKCKGMSPELFFPEGSKGIAEAKRVCSLCPVNSKCLDYALDNEIMFGIWGGKSARERASL